MKIHIKNGRLVDPKNRIDSVQDVFIAAGRIIAIGVLPEGFHANRSIDASN
ncbi:MAG: dihydroorotase, partial [Pseudomonadota bacterium]|nr:dihydroorotase [Pseudomonadota bacterium]